MPAGSFPTNLVGIGRHHRLPGFWDPGECKHVGVSIRHNYSHRCSQLRSNHTSQGTQVSCCRRDTEKPPVSHSRPSHLHFADLQRSLCPTRTGLQPPAPEDRHVSSRQGQPRIVGFQQVSAKLGGVDPYCYIN